MLAKLGDYRGIINRLLEPTRPKRAFHGLFSNEYLPMILIMVYGDRHQAGTVTRWE